MENNFKPIVGHKSQLRNEQWNLIVDCEVLVVEEPYKLSYTWVGGPINTLVTWTLKQEDGTTYLHLEQTGFEKEDQPSMVRNMVGRKWAKNLKKC
ncbi:UNVERIFIED_ORG: uncharacterized protein YndB with AHSA1/START domain [Peribacillus simplex]